MIVKFTEDHIFLKTDDPLSKRILLNALTATETKKGHKLPKNLWSMLEAVRYFPQLKDHTQFTEEGKQLRADVNRLLQERKKTFESRNGLRPYQVADIEYLKNLPAAGIFNEPRTGKTPTTIGLIKELGTKKNLIVCPSSLVYNWYEEFKKWYPELNVFIYDKSNKKEPPENAYSRSVSFYNAASALIISKDTLKKDAFQEKGFFDQHVFDMCFIDEGHFLRNYKTTQSLAVYAINAKRRYVLTGTPTVKHAADIYGILRFLYPKTFSSYWQFIYRYFEVSKDYFGYQNIGEPKPERLNELQSLIGLMSVQRKRKEVMQWLPDKLYTHIPVKFKSAQEKHYNDMLKFFATMQDDVEVDAVNVLSQLTRLRQICLDPRLIGLNVPGAKTEALMDFLEDYKNPIVIMSTFTGYLKMLKPMFEKLGLKVGMIHGEMSNQDKQKSAAEFQEGRISVLLCNIISAGTGFTLDRAETIIFLDKAWNPAENSQAEDRVCPTTIEKNHKHEIISFVCQDTVEQRIQEILDQKISITDYINKGGAEALRRLLRK